MIYRYELSVGGQLQGVGAIIGLGSLTPDALGILDEELPHPPMEMTPGTASFFTERGYEKFKDAMDGICKAYEDTLYDVTLLTLDEGHVPEDGIKYRDGFQLLMDRGMFLSLPFKSECLA